MGLRPSQARLPHSCPTEPPPVPFLTTESWVNRQNPAKAGLTHARVGPSQHLFLGSYMKRRFIRRRPASESHGNLCFRLL